MKLYKFGILGLTLTLFVTSLFTAPEAGAAECPYSYHVATKILPGIGRNSLSFWAKRKLQAKGYSLADESSEYFIDLSRIVKSDGSTGIDMSDVEVSVTRLSDKKVVFKTITQGTSTAQMVDLIPACGDL